MRRFDVAGALREKPSPGKGTRSRGDPGGLPADRAARRNPGVGRHAEASKPVLCRQMEVYAGFLEPPTTSAGSSTACSASVCSTTRWCSTSSTTTAPRPRRRSTYNEMLNFSSLADIETPFMTDRLDKFGGPESYNHYSVGWAHAMDYPVDQTSGLALGWHA